MPRTKKQSTEAAVREIRRRTRRKLAPEEKIRIVLEGLRGEQSISELCRRRAGHLDQDRTDPSGEADESGRHSEGLGPGEVRDPRENRLCVTGPGTPA